MDTAIQNSMSLPLVKSYPIEDMTQEETTEVDRVVTQSCHTYLRLEAWLRNKNGLLFIVTDKAWAFKNGFAHAPYVCFIQILKNTSVTDKQLVSFLRTRVDHVIFIS